MTPVVSFHGYSGSGKTSLLVKIIPLLKARGYRVGVIKHAHHGFDIDIQGKDSFRFSEAGSDIVALASPEKLAIIEKTERDCSLKQLVPMIADKVDIVLVEGFKHQGTFKLDVAKYNEKDAESLADLLEQRILRERDNEEMP